MIGKHVVRWTKTSTAVSTACSATHNPTAQTTEDVLHLDDARAFRPIPRPCYRYTVSRISPGLFHDHNSRHRRVTTSSHCTIFGLGVSVRFLSRPSWLNLGARQKRRNGRPRTKCSPGCRQSGRKLHRKCGGGWRRRASKGLRKN